MEIRPKFQNLIPHLAKHELEKLEASILEEGVRDPLTIAVFPETNVHGVEETARVLIDGHHRHEIATKHGLPFGTREIEFEDEDAAVIWMIDNQIGRRNIIHPLDRVILLENKRPILEKRARERQLSGKADDGYLAGQVPQGTSITNKKRQPTVTERLAAELKVSRNFYDDCLLILSKGIPALVKFIREGDLSITGAGKLLKHTPPGKHSVTDEEHQEWQQQLVDNVKGDPDAMQAVIRKINWNNRDYQRMCDREKAAEVEKKKKEEDFQAAENRDEEEIAKWQEEMNEAPEDEEQEAPEVEEELTETQEVEEVQQAPEEEQEAEEEETEAVTAEEEETEQEAPEKEQAVTEIHRRAQRERQDLVSELVTAIVNATAGILTTRGLSMSFEGQEVLADVLEAWVIEHATKYHLVIHHASTGEMVS